MRHRTTILVLGILIALGAAAASIAGIFTHEGPGPETICSFRGYDVELYGYGLYRHMSSDVAIQGIAQDYITLFLCVPLLVLALVKTRRYSLRWHFVLAGVLNYFLLTYLFYLSMAMYNAAFLLYVFLLSASFFAFALVVAGFDVQKLPERFSSNVPRKTAGSFLIFIAVCMAFLWLGVVVPPLLNGTIIPPETAHYTTLIVQGFDLAIFLPLGFVSGLLLLQNRPWGYMMASITLLFLPLLMTALAAKIIAMGMSGVNIIPVVFIIPVFDVVALTFGLGMLRSVTTENP